MEDLKSKLPSRNTQKVFHHFHQIGLYMFKKEKTQDQVNLLQTRFDIEKRASTIDWISTISYNFNLLEKTLALAVECFDYYLERNSNKIEHEEYPFLGLASLFLASKYEEIYPPNAQDFIIRGVRTILSNPKCLALNIPQTSKKLDFLKKRMFYHESQILKCLEFNTSRILAIDFLNYFAEDAGFNSKNKRYFYALYLLNISYLNPKLRSISQSLLAFAIIYFVNRIFSKDHEWPSSRADTSNANLLNSSTKKIVFLKVKERFEAWNKCQKDFKEKFYSGMDDIKRIGDSPGKNFNRDNRFLSKMSNSVYGDSRRNIATDRSLKGNSKIFGSNSIENNLKKNETRTVFTQKNAKKENEDKSTGISQVRKRVDIPNNISSFKLILGKSQMLSKENEISEDTQNKLKFKEIEFDFSKVKSVAMDVFTGKKK